MRRDCCKLLNLVSQIQKRVPGAAGATLQSACTLLTALTVLSRADAAPPRYIVTDLETPAGYFFTLGYGVNDLGDVTGYGQENFNEIRAIQWVGQIAAVLPASGQQSLSFDLNASGAAVGRSGSTTAAIPVRWLAGSVDPLPLLPGHTAGEARAINNAGVAVGTSTPNAGAVGGRAVVWIGHQAVPLSVPDGVASSTGTAISEGGAVAGTIRSAEYSGPVFWSSPAQPAQPIGLLPGALNGQCEAISSAGVVVGAMNGIDVVTPFIWDGELRPLATSTSLPHARARGINDTGIIVGEAGATPDTLLQAVIWVDEEMYELTALVHPASGNWELLHAFSINACGQIVGVGRLNGVGIGQAFLATPVRPGDFNLNGQVDDSDLGQLLDQFGCIGAACSADVNLDGAVDDSDLGILLDSFNKGCNPLF